MCLSNAEQTVKDLRELADLIQRLHNADVPEEQYYNETIRALITRTVGSLLGIVYPNNRVGRFLFGLYLKCYRGIPFESQLAVDWDAWVHSTVCD